MKPSQTPQNPKNSLSSRKLIGITIMLIIVAFMAFGALVAIDAVRTNHQKDLKAQQDLIADKATFAQAETDMDKAYAEIVAAIGKPAVEDKSKTCARSEQKFAHGNMNCGITYTFAYPDDNVGTSVARTLKLEGVLKADLVFPMSESGFSPPPSASKGFPQGGEEGLNYMTNLVCDLAYHHNKSELQNDGFDQITTTYSTLYQFSCSKDVSNAVYTQAE